ncbi:double-strand break repair helicase AddA [Pseudoroseicyclus tamaricis]|uniref:double-strand break repair helicase AddA n=1 Tax=Pseudoroseicyclus tamaricis TaxID=2705421 RepID=UPI001F329F83|nr:double-strand break repair helicase AddA [Pseudoroseicyclus tamaricis]
MTDAASLNQHRAAAPEHSTWLAANAGSGKTRVLTDRVARLLLGGAEAANILCLTYTKAAAGEMQNRLFSRLGAWAMLGDEELRAELASLGEAGPFGPDELADARTLFARAIEVPGGLRIQTIHAFCAALLRRFPLEAGVGPGFTEMEEREAELLRREIFEEMASGDDVALVDGLAAHLSGEQALTGLLAELAGKASVFAAPADLDTLRAALAVHEGETMEELCADIPWIGCEEDVAAAGRVLTSSGPNDRRLGEALTSVDWSQPLRAVDLEVLEGQLLTGSGAKEPFSAKIGTAPTKGVQASNPEILDWLDPLMSRIEAARPRRLALNALARAEALHAFAHRFVARLAEEKTRRGLLDFDDLITRASRLLVDRRVADWVLYRLDGGIDHILVDEAQDTSPGQWQVIEHLAREIVSGEGARGLGRTLFVVGDMKQSIYSFQGADPEGFARMREHFAAQLPPPGLQASVLQHSFRSAQAVLDAVDLTFARVEEAPLLPDANRHIAFRPEMPGRVDLWPALPKDESAPDLEFESEEDPVESRKAQTELAEQIASEIRRMIAEERLPVEEERGVWRARAIHEGDILILVRGRQKALYSEIIRACKAAGLAVAGKDRVKLASELAVRDIGAVIRFLALDDDNLSLAAALRSPLFGWSEQRLHRLAQPRGGKTLWQALRASNEREALAILTDLRDRSDYLRPYDLIMRLLTHHRGRKRLLERLGVEAEEGIDALLAQALAYERREIPSVTGFAEWMQTEEIDIKRPLGRAERRIRVMTVHGAKGLEAPIVILPDCATRPEQYRGAVLGEAPPFWAPKKDEMPPPLPGLREEALEADRREELRLLYVAMTRAEKWLIVAAAGTADKERDWHKLVADGLAHGTSVDLDTPAGLGRRLATGNWPEAGAEAADAPPAPPPPAPLELAPLPAASAAPALVSPSDLGGAKILPGDTALNGDGAAARRRGTQFHLLFEHLPALREAERGAAGRALLAAMEDPPEAEEAARLVADVRRLIAAPDLAPIFAAGTLAEVELTASPPAFHGRRLFGAIDRLIVTPEEVHAIDFKTNRIPPERPAATPEGILRQMAAYREMLREIYGVRPLRLSVLWTATGQLMTLPDALLDEALLRIELP